MLYFLPDVACFPILSFAVIITVCRHLAFDIVRRHLDFDTNTGFEQVACHFKQVFRLSVRVGLIGVGFPRVKGFIFFVRVFRIGT
jgi:hypothetical protein